VGVHGGTIMSKRDEYIEKMKDQLDELNELIDEMEGKTRNLKDETLVKYEKEINELRALLKSGKESLKDLKTASEDHWERLTAEGDKVYKAFVHSYNYFKSQLK